MIEDKTRELDKLARGESLDREEFLALLGDPAMHHELDQVAALSSVVGGPGVELELPEGFVMDVSWEELARHGDGTLTDETRRMAVERFLNQHFPEALGNVADHETKLSGGDTVINQRPPEQRE